MKIKLFTLCFLFLSYWSFGQHLTYSDFTSGAKLKNEYSSYEAKDGSIYKVGDKIKIGMPSSGKTFAFIHVGAIEPTPLLASYSGHDTEIKKIWIGGNKRTGHYAFARTKGYTPLLAYGIDIENAIESGEIKSLVMSSDEALAELKKAKDKFDLGIMTAEEYAKKKSELAPLIK